MKRFSHCELIQDWFFAKMSSTAVALYSRTQMVAVVLVESI